MKCKHQWIVVMWELDKDNFAKNWTAKWLMCQLCCIKRQWNGDFV